MSNRRKLRPFRASIITASEHVSSAYPHEACVYHPGCCDRDDFTCPGCGNTAIGAVMFQLNGVEQRRPLLPGARSRHGSRDGSNGPATSEANRSTTPL